MAELLYGSAHSQAGNRFVPLLAPLEANNVRVLIGCEESGEIRRAFKKLGHEAYSCDLLPARDGEIRYHLQHDVMDALDGVCGIPWDLVILHPPCTHIAVSGNAHYAGTLDRIDSVIWTFQLWAKARRSCARVCLENPVGLKIPDVKPQWIQPHEYGHDASKKTGLFLYGLPYLVPSGVIEPRIVNGRPRWGNQTDSGQNKLAPSEDRAQIRGTTYTGIAEAMAWQWGALGT